MISSQRLKRGFRFESTHINRGGFPPLGDDERPIFFFYVSILSISPSENSYLCSNSY